MVSVLLPSSVASAWLSTSPARMRPPCGAAMGEFVVDGLAEELLPLCVIRCYHDRRPARAHAVMPAPNTQRSG